MRAPPQDWTRSCVVATTVPYNLSVPSVSRFRFPSHASYSSRPLALSRSLSRRRSLFLSFLTLSLSLSLSLSHTPGSCRLLRGLRGPVSARRYPRGAAAVSCRLFPAALPTLLLLSGFCVVSARMRQRPTPVSRRAAGSLRLRHSFGRLVPLYMPPCRPRPTRQAVHQVPALHLGGGGGQEGE